MTDDDRQDPTNQADAELPAWSDPFHDPRLGPAPSLALDQPITAEWAYGDRTGRGARVAVIDSGVDAEHPLVGPVAEYVAITPDPDQPDGVRFEPGRHDDLYGHGTACAGIIRSLAPDVELVSVRVLGATLRGSARSFAHGLQWCIDHGVAAVNLSLSTSNPQYAERFHGLVDTAAFRRVLLVSAMNNELKRTIPSEYAGVFSVACGPGTDREQIWCNPTGPAEWGACGLDVEVAWTAGTTIRASGNSFAAAVVTGHLARILGAHPGVTPWQARTILAALAVNRPDSPA